MRLIWSEVAVEDLASIHDYISLEAPARADRFLPRLIAAVEPLARFPLMGRLVPEGNGAHREVLFEPCRLIGRLIDRVEEDEIYIVTVVHQARERVDLPEG